MKQTQNCQVVLFIIGFLWMPPVIAVCDVISSPPAIEMAYSRFGDAVVKSTSPYEMEGIATQLKVNGDNWRASHDYIALDYFRENLTTPITNGDLHTLAVAYRDTVNVNNNGNLFWEIQPTLAVSSNQLKNLDKVKGSSFRLDGHLIWQEALSPRTALIAGVCITALTGDYEVIPVMGVDYHYSDWVLSLAYPHTRIQYGLTYSLRLYSDWSLSGNQWEVLNKNLEQRSDMHLLSTQVRLGVQLDISDRAMIEGYWTHFYNQSMDYLARDDSRVVVDIDDVTGWLIRYVYLL